MLETGVYSGDMEKKFFTHEQALIICEKYQFLVGQTTNNNSDIVECVVVSPYDDINKWIFFNFYLEDRDPKKALLFYTPPFFDIIVILHSKSKTKNSYKDLQAYLIENNIELVTFE